MLLFETGAFYFIWNTISALVREIMEVLSERQLKTIAKHEYSSSGTSLCEPPLQTFWRWLVEKLPKHWAPNAITLAGLIINAFTSLTIFYYNPDARQPVPWWAYLLAAVGLFVYQTLDALDGKQARRTNSSSPLGELFDHGCDAVSTVFVTLSITLTLQLFTLDSQLFFGINLFFFFIFYLAHWSTYCTGSLQFGKVDVVETQLCIIGVFLIAAVFGESAFSTKMPLIGLDLRVICLCIMILAGAINVLRNLNLILFGGVGRSGSTVAGTSVLFPIFPIGTVIILAVMMANKTPAIFEGHPCLYIFCFGVVFAKITCKLIVAHMSKAEFNYFDSVYVGPVLMFINQYYDSIFSEYYLLWISTVLCSFNLVYYSCLITRQLCTHLNVYCFVITSRPNPVHQTPAEEKRVLRSNSKAHKPGSPK